jgi:cytochrome c-type biogenesis protein CcmH/NrfF
VSVVVVLAHAGHWLVSALYALPVVALLVALLVDVLVKRRRRRRGDGAT